MAGDNVCVREGEKKRTGVNLCEGGRKREDWCKFI